MSRYSLEIHPEALEEAMDAKRWYARQGGRALAEDFMERLDACSLASEMGPPH